MTKFYCTVVFDASANVTVEADSPEAAAELAIEQTDGHQRLCHHCSDTLDTGDALGAVVFDEQATKELHDSRYYPPRAKKPWVDLTEQELVDLRERVQQYTPMDSIKYGEAIQRATAQALKEKNHD